MTNPKRKATGTFFEHLAELRKRILLVLAVLVLAMFAGFWMADPLVELLKRSHPANGMEWHLFSPWDSLRIYMNIAFGIGALITLPFALYQLWAFVSPGLREEERRASLLFVPGAFLLALAGLAFGYFVVFPMTFAFTQYLAKLLDMTETYGASQYIGFMFNILIPLAVFFELPLVVLFLTKLGIISPQRLRKFRKYAYFFMFVIAAAITPSPDLASAVLVTIPMVALYELGVFLSGRAFRKKAANAADDGREPASAT